MNFVTSFLKDESGATMIEYALIAGLISVVAITALQGIGTQVNDKLGDVEGALQTAPAP